MQSNKTKVLKSDDRDLFSQKITEEQIQEIFRQIPFTVVVGPMFGAFITALLLVDYVDSVRILIWLALVLVSYSSFLVLWVWYKKTETNSNNLVKWGRRYLFLSWVAAASWGSASLFLFSVNSFIAQIILFMAVMIGAAAITISTMIYRPIFYTVVLLLVPLFIQFLRFGGENHYVMALGSVGFTFMLVFMNWNVNKVLQESIRLRFSNHQLATDLRLQKEVAEKASQAKSSFLAVASHDLRQPLQAHGLFLGELQERLPEDEVINDITEKLDSSLFVISELFDSLLDISRLEAGVVEKNIQSFYFDEFMKTIVEPYRVRAETLGLTLRVLIPHYVIKTDKVLLGRIICNLIENAVRNTQQGKILIGCRRRSGSLLIQVWDTGCGINENELDNIFTNYYQINHQYAKKANGLGLGLAVVNQLCLLLDHNISVSSVPGKGSMFSIEVPISEKEHVLNYSVNSGADHIHGLDGMKVLIMDDDESILQSMSGLLSAWKCDVVTGESADAIIDKIPPDYIPNVIITDYQLNNDKTGLQEIERLKDRFKRHIDAFVITGTDFSLYDDALKTCNYTVLQKPVSPAKLCALLRFIDNKN